MTPKITPPKGYRLMRPNERPDINRDDMVLLCGNWEISCQSATQTVRKSLGEYATAYARKKKGTR